MFTLVISLVVVLGAVAAVTMLVVRETAQPAMDDADPHRGAPPAPHPLSDATPAPLEAAGETDEPAAEDEIDEPAAAHEPVATVEPVAAIVQPRFALHTPAAPRRVVVAAPVRTSLGRRIRSALALVGLLTMLGVGAAVTIGAIVIGVLFAARQALG